MSRSCPGSNSAEEETGCSAVISPGETMKRPAISCRVSPAWVVYISGAPTVGPKVGVMVGMGRDAGGDGDGCGTWWR